MSFVAIGTFGRTPYVPGYAADLDPSIGQLRSSSCRRPDQLQPGSVLVVGASHSGTDIAYEVASGHPLCSAGGTPGGVPDPAGKPEDPGRASGVRLPGQVCDPPADSAPAFARGSTGLIFRSSTAMAGRGRCGVW